MPDLDVAPHPEDDRRPASAVIPIAPSDDAVATRSGKRDEEDEQRHGDDAPADPEERGEDAGREADPDEPEHRRIVGGDTAAFLRAYTEHGARAHLGGRRARHPHGDVACRCGASGPLAARAAAPVPRTEVAAAPFRGERRDRRLHGDRGDFEPRRPVPAGQAQVATPADPPGRREPRDGGERGRKLDVVGGYAQGLGLPRRDAFVFDGNRWSRLAPMPDGRAAAAAAIAGGKLYVVGGISLAAADLARDALVLDLATGEWSAIAWPTPREHLAGASANGLVYALAGGSGT